MLPPPVSKRPQPGMASRSAHFGQDKEDTTTKTTGDVWGAAMFGFLLGWIIGSERELRKTSR